MGLRVLSGVGADDYDVAEIRLIILLFRCRWPSTAALGYSLGRNCRLTRFHRCRILNPQHRSETGIFCAEPLTFLMCQSEPVFDFVLATVAAHYD